MADTTAYNTTTAVDIQTQNWLLIHENEIAQNVQINDTKTRYQTEMYNSVKTANIYLLFFYYFLFILIHILLAEQYFRGVARNHTVDTIWFTVFFLYPLVIYYVETYVYFGVMYLMSMIYGTSYIPNFDKALLHTNFYLTPNINTANTAMPNNVSTNFT